MVMHCVAYGCNNQQKQGNKSYSFHRFPHNRPEILSKWIIAIRRKNWKPTKYSRLCSKHFTEDCYQVRPGTKLKLLKEDAVPSIFDFPSHLIKKKRSRRILDRPALDSSTSTFIAQNKISRDIDMERYDNSNGSGEVQSSTSAFIVKQEISQDIDMEKYDNSNGSSEEQFSTSTFIIKQEISSDIDMERYDNSNGRSEVQSSTSTSIAQKERSQSIDMGGYDNSNGSSEIQSSTVVALRKKVKTLQQKLRRRKVKIQSMNDLISNLRNSKCTTDNLEETLGSYFSGIPLEILMQQLKKPKHPSGQQYSPIVKEFALTLYFHSPKAFRYVRQFWNLPHPSKVKNWLSSVRCHPGLLGNVFSYLKQEIDNMPHVRDCALMFHSMSIRKQISYNASLGKTVGYIDLGGIVDVESDRIATEALVFMIASLSGNFKCPIAYFFISKISPNLQVQIIKVCLERLSEVGIAIHSLTCDGTAVNIQTLNHLGCKVCVQNLDSLKSSFKHPVTGTDVAVFLDPCHMLKLAKDTLADKGIITSEIGDVKWEYIVKLNRLQEQEQLKFSSKLSRTHVYFWNKKHNVKLAAETLSSGVADALHYLLMIKHPDFEECEPTIRYIRILNQLFDILNSRNPFGKGFKQPLRMENKIYLDAIFEQSLEYLTSLSVNGSAIMLHPRKTFVLGFAMCIKSAQLLITNVLKKNSNSLKYLLLYKTSQDHLELFFSCIRARANNNPNVDQFRWAVKKLLFCKNICVANFNIVQYSIFEFRSTQRCLYDDSVCSNDTELQTIMSQIDSPYISEISENIFVYIAGYIIKKLMRNLTCDRCCNILVKIPFESDHTYASNSYFINCVERGGLVFASDGVIEIIKYIEKSFRLFRVLHGITKNLISKRIARSVIHHFSQAENYRKLEQWGFCHAIMAEISFEDLHETQLIRKITEIYIEIRLHSNRKQYATLMMQDNAASVRQKLNNSILFSNV